MNINNSILQANFLEKNQKEYLQYLLFFFPFYSTQNKKELYPYIEHLYIMNSGVNIFPNTYFSGCAFNGKSKYWQRPKTFINFFESLINSKSIISTLKQIQGPYSFIYFRV